jgi:DNA-directed RNA polymerase subunit RPC12/RpoP
MKQQNQALLDDEVKLAATKSQVLYQCQGCQNMFASMKDVNGHMCRGKKTGKFTLAPETAASLPRATRDYHCTKCGATFNTLLALYSHEKTHVVAKATETVKYVECSICKLQFPSDDKLQAHRERHKRLRCNNCSVVFKSIDEFEKHIALTAKLYADFCITCSKIFINKDNLDAHLQQEHAHSDRNEHVALRVIYTCQCCNQEFSDMKSFADHKVSHGTNQFETMYEADKEITFLGGPPTDQLQKLVKLKTLAESDKPAEVDTTSNSQLNNSDHSYSLATTTTDEVHIISDDEDLLGSIENESVTPAKVTPTKVTASKKTPSEVPNKIVADSVEQVEQQIDKTKPCVFECGMCDVRANSLENLIKHFQSHKDKPIVCKHCNITLPSVAALSKHLQYHTKSSQGVECMVRSIPVLNNCLQNLIFFRNSN